MRILIRANFQAMVRSQRVLLVFLAACVVAMLAFQGVVGAGVSKYARTAEYQSVLNLIEVSTTGSGITQDINEETLKTAALTEGVQGVYPWYQVDLAMTNAADWPDGEINPGAVWATPVIPGLMPKMLLGAIPEAGLRESDIVLPHKVPGGTLDHLLGKTVTMEFTALVTRSMGEPVRKQFHVVAISDNDVPGRAGEQPSYVSDAALRAIYQRSGLGAAQPQSYQTAYVRVRRPSDVPAVQKRLSEQGFGVQSVAVQMRSLGGLFATLRTTATGLTVVLALFCLAFGASIGSSWVRQRRREIGLLRSLGWSSRRVAYSIFGGLGLTGAVVGLIGCLVGVVASLVGTAVVAATEVDLLPIDPWQAPPWHDIALVLMGVPLCMCLGGAVSAWRASRLDPDEALRDL